MLRRELTPQRKKAIKRVLMKRRLAATGPPAEVVEAVYERASHSCEICDVMVRDRRGIDHHLHHRRPRGAGGTRREDSNEPQNLMLLCPGCHSTVESHRNEAYAMGWLVGQALDPAHVSVLVCGRWVLLTPDGGYRDAGETS